MRHFIWIPAVLTAGLMPAAGHAQDQASGKKPITFEDMMEAAEQPALVQDGG